MLVIMEILVLEETFLAVLALVQTLKSPATHLPMNVL